MANVGLYYLHIVYMCSNVCLCIGTILFLNLSALYCWMSSTFVRLQTKTKRSLLPECFSNRQYSDKLIYRITSKESNVKIHSQYIDDNDVIPMKMRMTLEVMCLHIMRMSAAAFNVF